MNHCRTNTTATARVEYVNENLFVPLKHRSLVRTYGIDSIRLLQNLTTNDVSRLVNSNYNAHAQTQTAEYPHSSKSNGARALSSAILNPLGRVMFDVIIYNCPHSEKENELIIECESEARADLIKHLKKYKLRAKVKIEQVDDLGVVAFIGKNAAQLALQYSRDTSEIVVVDPRHPSLGTRALLPLEPAADVGTSLTSPDFLSNLVEGSSSDYSKNRYHVGVPEGLVEITRDEAFPLESNFDVLAGIDFDKGCYIGQELTARAKFVGVTRKRLLPISLTPSLSESNIPVAGTEIKYEGKSVGKFKYGIDNDGIALLRLSVLNKQQDVELLLKGRDDTQFTVTHRRPTWFVDMLEGPDDQKK
eukprot:CFRG0362T1